MSAKKKVKLALLSFAVGFLTCPDETASLFLLSPAVLALMPHFGGQVLFCFLGQIFRLFSLSPAPLPQKNILWLLLIAILSLFFKSLRKKPTPAVGIVAFSSFVAGLFYILLYDRSIASTIILLCEGIVNLCLCFFLQFFVRGLTTRKKLPLKEKLAGGILFLFLLFCLSPPSAYGQSMLRILCLALLLLICDFLPLREFVSFGLSVGICLTLLQKQNIFYIIVWTSGVLLLGLTHKYQKRWQLLSFWIGYTVPLALSRIWWGQPEFWWEPIFSTLLYAALPAAFIYKHLSPYFTLQKRMTVSSPASLVAQYKKITDELCELPAMQNRSLSPNLLLRDQIQSKLTSLGFTPLSVTCSTDSVGGITIDIAFQTNGHSLSRYVILGELEKELTRPLTLHSFFTDGNRCVLKAVQRYPYCLQSAALYRPKAGEKVCGDNAAAFHTDSKHYALLLSDGMGSGEKAFCQSTVTVQLLQKLLRGGFSAKEALELLHSSLRLQNETLGFATVDLCEVSLDTGQAVLTKAGAVSTYLLRGDRITELSAVSFPVGMTAQAETATLQAKLEADDILLMISDGALQNPDALLPALMNCRDLSPHRMAQHLMQEITKSLPKNAQDDITVIVSKFMKNTA